MPEPRTLEERLQKTVEDLDRRAKQLESLECPTIPTEDDWWPVPSDEIILTDGVIRDIVARAFNLAAWTQHPNSTIALTLEEPGYIWFQYYCFGYNATATRVVSVSVQVFIDGVAQATYLNSGATLNHRMSWTLANRSDAIVAAGPHNVDLRVYVVNAGDAVTISQLSGVAFYTRG